MGKLTTPGELPTSAERQAFLEQELRRRTREWIQSMVNEELEAALGCGPYERTWERRGYHKGARARCFTTTGGKHTLRMPRGAYFDPGADGTREWRSELIPRYARRTEEVESALVLTATAPGTSMGSVRPAFWPPSCTVGVKVSPRAR